MNSSKQISLTTIFAFITFVVLTILFAHHILSIIWVICLCIYKIIFLLPLYIVQSFYSYFLYITAIIFAILIILLNNPIYSLLSLIIVFFHVLLFLLALKIEFLSLIFLIVYVGAIAILFLFVIMMFNLKNLTSAFPTGFTLTTKAVLKYLLLVYPLFKFFFIIEKHLTVFVLNNIVNSNFVAINNLNLTEIITHKVKDVLFFSDVLYTYYAFSFILSSFILFAAMIGAIMLALQSNIANK